MHDRFRKKEDCELNNMTCPICESANCILVTNKVRFNNSADVYNCQDCTLTFLDQRSFKFSPDFYEKEYHQTYLTHVEPDALNPELYFEKMKKSTKQWADKFANMLTGKENVLDIGCSTGHFMALIKDRALNVYGSDLNKKEVQFCRDILKLDASCEPLHERFDKGMFDYITMIYVLEHIARPKEFLNMVKPLLKPGGKIVILVPNIQDALMNFYDIPEFRSFYYCIEHLFYYNQYTITKLFDSTGLSGNIEVIQEYPVSNHLNWSYRKSPSDTLAARRGIPDVPLSKEASVKGWESLWSDINKMYQDFLKTNGYGDRLWCVIGLNKDE